MKVRLIFKKTVTVQYSYDDYGAETECKTVVVNLPISNERKEHQMCGDWQIIGYEEVKEANQTLATMNEGMRVELEKKRVKSQGITNKLHQLAKAKNILKRFLEEEKNNMYWEMNGSDKSSYYKVRKEAEQFLSEAEK